MMKIYNKPIYSVNMAVFTLIAFLGLTACDTVKERPVVKNETVEAFVKRYVNEVNEDIKPTHFSQFWYARGRKNLHDTPTGLAQEMSQAVAIHRLLRSDNTLDNVPAINDWGDEANTMSLTYDLNQPKVLKISHIPDSGDAPWLQYQITLEKEEGGWVVSGESLVR